ncbi:hypothetical protein G7Y89_g5392 [Cudoniella acicularis]|uniref:Uncharacterized protein n=1 Tax=Cudoniella acicularis TaxID=354080 RepID=A0A8H4W418_9HELO|nr:hypothetical protein G7Y89_g5392 [Cudoniella acicularis]
MNTALGTSAVPILISATAPTQTISITSTQSHFITQQSTQTLQPTTTSTTTFISGPTFASPSWCLIENATNDCEVHMIRFYAGYSFQVAFPDPGNTSDQSATGYTSTTIFLGPLHDAQALQSCFDYTQAGGPAMWTFWLVYSVAEAEWTCTSYENAWSDVAYISVPDSDIGRAYLYSAN